MGITSEARVEFDRGITSPLFFQYREGRCWYVLDIGHVMVRTCSRECFNRAGSKAYISVERIQSLVAGALHFSAELAEMSAMSHIVKADFLTDLFLRLMTRNLLPNISGQTFVGYAEIFASACNAAGEASYDLKDTVNFAMLGNAMSDATTSVPPAVQWFGGVTFKQIGTQGYQELLALIANYWRPEGHRPGGSCDLSCKALLHAAGCDPPALEVFGCGVTLAHRQVSTCSETTKRVRRMLEETRVAFVLISDPDAHDATINLHRRSLPSEQRFTLALKDDWTSVKQLRWLFGGISYDRAVSHINAMRFAARSCTVSGSELNYVMKQLVLFMKHHSKNTPAEERVQSFKASLANNGAAAGKPHRVKAPFPERQERQGHI